MYGRGMMTIGFWQFKKGNYTMKLVGNWNEWKGFCLMKGNLYKIDADFGATEGWLGRDKTQKNEGGVWWNAQNEEGMTAGQLLTHLRGWRMALEYSFLSGLVGRLLVLGCFFCFILVHILLLP
jgi:hypothetical protein